MESRESMQNVNKINIIKTLLVFVIYFLYVNCFVTIFGNSVSINFIADLLFLILMIVLYKDAIKNSLDALKKKKIIKEVFVSIGYALVLLVCYMVIGMVLMELFPEMENFDGNTVAIYSIYSLDTIYTIFKTLVFASIAEELLFKESIRTIIKPNAIYILVSGLIYAFVNIMYNDLSLPITWLNMIPYLLFAVLLNVIYVKNDNNICLVMMVKFFYNLIPLTVLLSGLGA